MLEQYSDKMRSSTDASPVAEKESTIQSHRMFEKQPSDETPYSRILTPHDYTQSELNSVKRILKRETGHGQIYKQSICVILLVALIV